MTQPGNILDFLTDAVHRYMREGEQGIAWIFHHCMTREDHVRFDLWLVKMKDPLAWEPGTPWSRFRRRAKAMADAYLEARPEKEEPSQEYDDDMLTGGDDRDLATG